jgi:hypothetical protein
VDLFSFAAWRLREKKNRSRQAGKTQRRKEKSLCGLEPLRELNKKYTLAKKDSLPAGLVHSRKKSAAADSPSTKDAKKGGLIILCSSAPSREKIRRGGLAKYERRKEGWIYFPLRLCAFARV